MSHIHQLFTSPENETVERIMRELERTELCWYPSAGDDVRHIDFLENERLEKTQDTVPLTYLHTGMHMPSFLDTGRSKIAPGMDIASITELTFKRPTREVSDVYSFKADENTGRAFFIQLALKRTVNGRKIIIPVPLIYTLTENLIFLVQCLLLHSIYVNTLVHIKDGGGSFGGSRIPMDFIYHVTDFIKVKRVITEWSVKDKDLFDLTGYPILENECKKMHEFRVKESFRRENPTRASRKEFGIEKLRYLSEEEMKSRWQSKPIPRRQFPVAYWSAPDRRDYDCDTDDDDLGNVSWRTHDGHYHDWSLQKTKTDTVGNDPPL